MDTLGRIISIEKSWGLQEMKILRRLESYVKLICFYAKNRDFNFHRRIEWDLVSRWLQTSHGDRESICDIGCANGFYTHKLAKQGFNALGIDSDNEAICLAHRHRSGKRTEFMIGDAQRLPLQSASLDKVILVSVLEHIINDEQALEEITRVLKPGGCLVMSVDSLSHETVAGDFKERHRRRYLVERYYTLPDLRRMLERHSLRFEEGRYILNSRVSNFFFSLHHAYITFPISYPLSKISDRLFGSEESGAMIVVKATKE